MSLRQPLDRANWAGQRTQTLVRFTRSPREAVSILALAVVLFFVARNAEEQTAAWIQGVASMLVAYFVMPLLEVGWQMFRAPSIGLQQHNIDLQSKVDFLGSVERELIDLKASHARDVERDKAIETFRGLLSFDVEAAYTEGSDGSKVWALWGGHAVHMRACEGACRVAAHALENSKLYATLPEHIRAEQDGLSRWLHFVAHRDGWTGFTGEGVDNTQDPPLTTKSKGIKEIALSSKRLCEYCKNSETYL